MTTSNPPTAAQPIDLFPCPFCGGENIDPAEWSGNDGKSGPGCGDCGALAESVEAWNTRALARQQPAASEQASAAGAGSEQPLAEAIHAAAVKAGIIAPGTAVSGPQLVMLCDALAQLAAAPAAPHAQAAPAARVDRIISASGLAEVSVFLESALKVGTVFYAAAAHAAAAPSAEQAPAAARRAAERINAMHKGVVSVLSEIRAEHETGTAAKTEQPPSGNTGEVAASVKTWQRVTAPGQVKVGDKLRFTIGDSKYNETVKLVLDAGTDREELIYNRRMNYYVITKNAMTGFGSSKNVEFLPKDAQQSTKENLHG